MKLSLLAEPQRLSFESQFLLGEEHRDGAQHLPQAAADSIVRFGEGGIAVSRKVRSLCDVSHQHVMSCANGYSRAATGANGLAGRLGLPVDRAVFDCSETSSRMASSPV
jgi:hypothetical protein